MTQQEHKTVFISYRRNVASFIARAIFMDLREHGYDVFMDVESIDSGQFDRIILNQIEARAHFLIILTPGTVERCVESGDWLRKEIEYAMEKQRNVVPLLINYYNFNDAVPYLTGKLAQLPTFNALNVPHDFFDAAMERLRTRFLKLPVYGKLKPAPTSDQLEVQRKIEEVAAQPDPTQQELSAEDYFNKAMAMKADNEQEIVYYNEAIRLNPRYTVAYNNRGAARYHKSDFDGAIADYSEAIRLNPQYTTAYNNRGAARQAKGDFGGAIADYDEVIRLNPRYATAYNNRGAARQVKGDLDGAIADYSEAIRLNPQYANAYNNRGNASYAKGDFDSAIPDYCEAIRLNPTDGLAYGNRGQTYFAVEDYGNALDDFRQSNNLRPADNMPFAGLAITHHVLGAEAKAKRIWQTLIAQDERYRDADWVGKELNWAPPLIEAARKLIAEL